MGINVNKDGKVVKTTIRAKNIVLTTELNFPLLVVAAIMMSVLNILYLVNGAGLL